jgi:hypothetical protein
MQPVNAGLRFHLLQLASENMRSYQCQGWKLWFGIIERRSICHELIWNPGLVVVGLCICMIYTQLNIKPVDSPVPFLFQSVLIRLYHGWHCEFAGSTLKQVSFGQFFWKIKLHIILNKIVIKFFEFTWSGLTWNQQSSLIKLISNSVLNII